MSDPELDPELSWAEVHGYTNRCAGCGQITDSTYCSVRCELDDLARERAEKTKPDIDGCGDTAYDKAEED